MADNKKTQNQMLETDANQHILADHYGLTPKFIKDNKDALDKINQLVRKTLKYTNDDDPRAIRDRMIALQRITKDTFVSGTYADSLVGRVSDGTKSSITDHGFRAVYGENTDKEDLLTYNFHSNIFATYRNLVSEYRNIARLIPEVHRCADMKARDILAINEITKKAVTNVYKKSKLEVDPTEVSPLDQEKDPINERINNEILDHYDIENKLQRYLMTALIEGAKPVAVYPYSDIVEMAHFNIKRFSTTFSNFDKQSSECASSESLQNLMKECCIKTHKLVPSFESFGTKYKERGSEALDTKKSWNAYVSDVVDMYISKEDQQEYFKQSIEDIKTVIEKKKNKEISDIMSSNELDKIDKIHEVDELYKDLTSKVKIDGDLEPILKGQIFNAIKTIDERVEFYNQSETPMAMAINNFRRLAQFTSYSDKKNIGVIAGGAQLKKELRPTDGVLDPYGVGDKKVFDFHNEFGNNNDGTNTDNPKSALDEFDAEFSENSKKLMQDCIIKEYDSEDVVPVIISGKHVGYYAIETSAYTGNVESVNKRNCNFTDMFINLGFGNDFPIAAAPGMNGTSAAGISASPMGGVGPLSDIPAMGMMGGGAMALGGGMDFNGGFDLSTTADDAVHRNNIMKRIIFNIMKKKLQNNDIGETDDEFSDTLMNLIRDGAIVRNNIRVMFIPEKYMCYFTPALDGNGIPQSFLKDCLFTCYEKILVNMNNIMTRLTRTGTKDKITLNVGKAKNMGMSIRGIENAMTTRKLNVESPFSSLSRVLRSASLSETIIEPIYDGEKLFEYEDISLKNDAQVQDDLEEKLTNQIVTALKCPITITNPYQEEDFASIAASRNAEYRFDIIKLQQTFARTATKFVRLLIVGSGMFKELKEGTPEIKLSNFQVEFAPPENLNMKNANETFGTVSSFVDAIMDIVFDPDDDTQSTRIAKFKFKQYMYQIKFPGLGLPEYIQYAERIKNTSMNDAIKKQKHDSINEFINATQFEPITANSDGTVTSGQDNQGTGNGDDGGW